jgi:hypothetical protein
VNARQPAGASPADAVTTPGREAPQAPPASSEVPLVLDRATITRALADGTAVPLTSHVTSFVHHRDVWWLDDDDAWLQITDESFIATLHIIHSRQE